MNKYGGYNDLPACDKRVYNLWFQMLRRCYDTSQHGRDRGKTYADCVVCERWMRLSCFAKDIQKLKGYEEWRTKTGYCLDKYTINPDGEVLMFDSEKAACEYLGVVKCSVSSCYHKGYKCKGYKIAKMEGESDE